MFCQVPTNQSCYHRVDSAASSAMSVAAGSITERKIALPHQFKHINCIYHLRSSVTFLPCLLNSSYLSLKTNNILFCNIQSYLDERIVPVRIIPWENGLHYLQCILVPDLKWSWVPSGVCNAFQVFERTNPFLLLARRLQFLPSPRSRTHTIYRHVHNPLVLSFIPTYLVMQTVRCSHHSLPWQLLYPALLLKQFTASDGK